MSGETTSDVSHIKGLPNSFLYNDPVIVIRREIIKQERQFVSERLKTMEGSVLSAVSGLLYFLQALFIEQTSWAEVFSIFNVFVLFMPENDSHRKLQAAPPVQTLMFFFARIDE